MYYKDSETFDFPMSQQKYQIVKIVANFQVKFCAMRLNKANFFGLTALFLVLFALHAYFSQASSNLTPCEVSCKPTQYCT